MSRMIVTGLACAALLALGGPQAAQAATKHTTTASSHVISGEVTSVNAADQTFVVQHHVKGKPADIHFTLASAGKVTKDGAAASFDDIQPKEKVKVTYKMEQKKHMAEDVAIGAAQSASTKSSSKSMSH